MTGDAVAADFDGDRQIDAAVTPAERRRGIIVSRRYTINLKLSTKTDPSSFTFYAQPGGLDLAARDVDGDRDLDLVITTRFTGEHVGVWVNDGTGNSAQGTLDKYPAWVWGGGPRLIRGAAIQKSTTAIFSHSPPFIAGTHECTVAAVSSDDVSRLLQSFPEIQHQQIAEFARHRNFSEFITWPCLYLCEWRCRGS